MSEKIGTKEKELNITGAYRQSAGLGEREHSLTLTHASQAKLTHHHIESSSKAKLQPFYSSHYPEALIPFGEIIKVM